MPTFKINKYLYLVMLLSTWITAQAEINWSGYFHTDNSLLMRNWSLPWQEYRLSLQTDYKPNDNLHFFTEIWFRSFGISNVTTSSELDNKQKVAPVEIDWREGYIDLYGLFNKNLDICIGRQRIAWGVADKINPTDNLNPNDLEDIWDFGRKLAVNSIKVSYYINNLTISGVFIPSFAPAVLPKAKGHLTGMSSWLLLPDMHCQSIADTIILPASRLKESAIYGAKVSKNVLGYDLSLSYIWGRYDLPILSKMTLQPANITGLINLKSELIYPRRQIIGFDIAGAIKDVGVWFETAIFFPEKTFLTIDMSALGLGIFDSLILDNKPYCQYVFGLDYTFANGIYINGQYLYGFITERGQGNLHNYLMLGLDWKLLDNKLTISPINGAIEIKKMSDLKNNYALVLSPIISYKPLENTEFNCGIRLIDGSLTTTFGQLKDDDAIFLKLKYNF